MLNQKTTGSDVLWILCDIELLVSDHGSIVHVDSTLDHYFELPRFEDEDRGTCLSQKGIWSCIISFLQSAFYTLI